MSRNMASSSKDDWRQQIRKKLTEIYGNEKKNMENLIKLLAFFNKEVEKEHLKKNYVSPFNQTLKMAFELKNDSVFKGYADQMLKDATECLKNPEFYEEMLDIYEKFVEPDFSEEDAEEEALLIIANLEKTKTKGLLTGLSRMLLDMRKPQRGLLIRVVRKVVKTYTEDFRAMASAGSDGTVALFNKVPGALATVGLAAVNLTFECWRSISLWWKGQISGKRCAKICIDSMSQMTAGVGGGIAGAAIGTVVCPLPVLGTIVGGLAGGLLCGLTAKALTDSITRKIFDLPKEVAVERAYKFLGVHHKASNNEVNKQFHRLALICHPDKGGRKEDFHLLQFHMANIKLARGEKYP
ncbi:unnamed protein product [Orchesella dallaii]|uniref:J domain-containing protein n=1 Tax=Orchesella dallaii TaxID=48710 RepID=A0ABP1RDF5_9HEXA